MQAVKWCKQLPPHTINGQQLINQSTAPGLTYWGERESHYGMILSKPFIQGFTSQETSDLFQALNSHDTRTGQKCHKNQKLQWWLSQTQTKMTSRDCASLVIISRTSSEKQRILQASQSNSGWLCHHCSRGGAAVMGLWDPPPVPQLTGERFLHVPTQTCCPKQHLGHVLLQAASRDSWDAWGKPKTKALLKGLGEQARAPSSSAYQKG